MLQPDIVFYIDVSLETIKKRAGFGDERYEREELQIKVKEQYENFKKVYLNSNKLNWQNIDGNNKSVDQIFEEIKIIVEEKLN